MDDTALIVFLKVPQKGRVKTRLASEFDEEFVLHLYISFVKDLLEAIEPVKNKTLYFWPQEEASQLESFVGNNYECHPQQGQNLGQKMANALEAVFKTGVDKAVLIGTDIPEINLDILFQASAVLDTTDAVIGPTGDGGYYLIGFQRSGYCQSVFKNIEWSSPTVFEQTTRYLKKNNISYGAVTPLEDIDTPEDLKNLIVRVKHARGIGPRTKAVLDAI